MPGRTLLALLLGLTACEIRRRPPPPPPRPVAFTGLRTAKYSVADLARAKAWYTELLGVQPYFDEPYYVGFNVEGFELGLTPDSAARPGRPEAGVAYWGVSSADSAYQRLIALGATPAESLLDVGDGIRVASVLDPFGNRLGIIQNPRFAATPVGAGRRP